MTRDQQPTPFTELDLEAKQTAETPLAEPVAPATLVTNSAWGFAASIAATLVSGGVSIYAVRTLTERAWGRYSTATALIAIFAVLSDLGLATLVLRNMTARPDEESTVLGIGVRAVLRTAAVSAVAIIPVALVLGYDGATVRLVALGIPVLFVQPLTAVISAAFNARRRLMYSSQLTLFTLPLWATVAIVLIAIGFGAAALVIATVVSACAGFAACLFLLDRRLHLRPLLAVPRRAIGPFIRLALPIALIGGISILYDRIDVVILSNLRGAVDVAQYSVAYSLAKLTWAIPAIVGAAFFPLYTKLTKDAPAEASRAFFLIIRIFTYVSGATAFFLTFAGRDLVKWVFGARYADAAAPLAILAWGLVASFQNYVLWYAVLASRLERLVVPIQILGLTVNIIANLALIPSLGPSGAALAFLLSDVVTTGGQFVLVHRRIHPVPVASLAIRPVVACVPAVVAGVTLLPISPIVSGIVGTTLYVVTLQALKYVSFEEWRPLTGAVEAALRSCWR